MLTKQRTFRITVNGNTNALTALIAAGYTGSNTPGFAMFDNSESTIVCNMTLHNNPDTAPASSSNAAKISSDKRTTFFVEQYKRSSRFYLDHIWLNTASSIVILVYIG